MNLSPTAATAAGTIGHRRGASSAIDIRVSDIDEVQEKTFTEPLLPHGEDDKYDHQFITKPDRHSRTLLAGLWLVSLVATSLLTYFLTTHGLHHQLSTKHGSFATGFTTELLAARSAIFIHQQHFHGSLDFNGHHGFVPLGSPSLRYIGSTPDVDAAWEELSRDRYFLLTDDEAREAYGVDVDVYWNVHHGGYVAGLDVLHTLHCTNHLRQSIYPEVYPQDPVDGPIHKAHCIEMIRQHLLCNADLTAIPTQYFTGLQRNYINASRPHTCRDFSRIREWATERFNGTTAVKARNRDGSPRENFYAPWGP